MFATLAQQSCALRRTRGLRQPSRRPRRRSSAARGIASDTYVIGGNDVLAVTVWKEPTLSGSMLVRPDGMISHSPRWAMFRPPASRRCIWPIRSQSS